MKSILLNSTICLSLLLFISDSSKAQIQINDSLTSETLVNDFFNSGVLVSIANITFNDNPTDVISPQLGLFTNGGSDSLNMESGLLMFTGPVGVIGGNSNSTLIENYQDSDIQLMTGMPVNDCAVIEFDVFVEADALAFSYFFASMEYASFTCSNFNDGFGLFISGPGIDGPYANNAMNIATIPNSETAVAINTVNSGVSSYPGNEQNCENANPNWIEDSQYFINNSSSEVNDLPFSGYTHNFEAYVEVVNGETYHIKFAICDASDGALDSGVFLEAGSFEGRIISGLKNSDLNDLRIYPNPAKEFVRLDNVCPKCSGNVSISITDVQGRLITQYEKANTETIEISTEGIENGIYMLNVLNGSKRIGTSKLIIE